MQITLLVCAIPYVYHLLTDRLHMSFHIIALVPTQMHLFYIICYTISISPDSREKHSSNVYSMSIFIAVGHTD